MSGELFGRRTILIAIPVAAVSLVGSLLALALGPELFEPGGVGPSRFSRSAIGHRAFFDLLERLGVEVDVSRADAWHKVTDGSLLVIAEPELPEGAEAGAPDFAEELPYGRTLIILPKWEAIPHPQNPRFAMAAEMLPPADVRDVLTAIADAAGFDDDWELLRPRPDTLTWEAREVAGTPSLPFPQLIRHPELETWIGAEGRETGSAALVGRLRSEDLELIIVSDPDLISNHGLVRSDAANAVLAVELVEKLLEGPRRVVVDESCHGAGVGGFWSEALRFPMVLVILHAALLSGAVLWGAMGRFGAPAPEALGLAAGSRGLIESTAELLRFGGHWREALRRYLRVVVDGACRRLRGPETGTLRDRVRWLAARAERRGVDADIVELAAAAAAFPERGSEEMALDFALEIERFRGELGDAGDRGGR